MQAVQKADETILIDTSRTYIPGCAEDCISAPRGTVRN